MAIKELRYTIEFKAGYRIIDNLTGEYVGEPYEYPGLAIQECRMLNRKDRNEKIEKEKI